MKKFEGILFCTDLDGTLYTSKKNVSRKNLEAIEYFKAEGGLFTFVTGRVPLTAEDVWQIVKPNAPYGCVNGAAIYDNQLKRYLWNLSLSENATELLHEVNFKLPEIGIQLNTENDVFFSKDNPAMEHFRAVTGLPNHYCPYDNSPDKILKVVFAHDDEEQILALEKLLLSHPLANEFDFIRSERRLYEILPKGAGKGVALSKMAELLRINPQKTIAVGDYYNDISMLKVAGLGFAVANAIDAVKETADYVTKSNNDDAIAAIIEGLDNGTYRI